MQLTLTMGNLHEAGPDPINVTCNMSFSSPSVEWTSRYRERLRQDPMAWENYKRKEAERKRAARKNMSDEQRKIENERTRLRRKRRILKMALANLDVSAMTATDTGEAEDANSSSVTESPDGNLNISQTESNIMANILSDPSKVERLVLEKQREFWREKKRQYRAKMSEEKKQSMRENDAQRKRQIRAAFKEASQYWQDKMAAEGMLPPSESYVGQSSLSFPPQEWPITPQEPYTSLVRQQDNQEWETTEKKQSCSTLPIEPFASLVTQQEEQEGDATQKKQESSTLPIEPFASLVRRQEKH